MPDHIRDVGVRPVRGRAVRLGRRLGAAAFDAGFGHPRGVLGRIGAVVMAVVNAEQESLAVIAAGVRSGERVLVVGCGPGLGVERAAARVGSSGRVVAIDPSALMGRLTRRRCRARLAAGVVEVRAGTAERTGCPDASVDVVISVNNVMLWHRPQGLAELVRVLVPDGRLVISVHRHVLPVPPEQLVVETADAGFIDVDLRLIPRRRSGPAVELQARRPPGRPVG